MRKTRHRRTLKPASVLGFVALSLALAGCATVGPNTASNGSDALDAKYQQAMRMAESVRASGDLPSAAVFYQRAHTIDTSQSAPLIGLGETAANLGSTGKAIEYFRAAIALSANDASLRRKYGGLLLRSGDPAQALDVYREAAALDPTDARAFNGMAVAFDLLGQPGEAQQAYARALGLKPDDPATRSNLALSKALAGQHDEAVAMLTQLSAEPSAGPRTRQNLALALALKGQVREAAAVAAKDVSEADLRSNIAVYRSLARLPQQERAAVVFGLANRPAGNSTTLANHGVGDERTTPGARRPSRRLAPAALASDAFSSEENGPAERGGEPGLVPQRIAEPTTETADNTRATDASGPTAAAVATSPASAANAAPSAPAGTLKPGRQPASVAAIDPTDPVTEPVLPAPAEPLTLPVALRGSDQHAAAGSTANTRLGFSFIEPAQPGRTLARTPPPAGGVLVLQIDKAPLRSDIPQDTKNGQPVAAAPSPSAPLAERPQAVVAPLPDPMLVAPPRARTEAGAATTAPAVLGPAAEVPAKLTPETPAGGTVAVAPAGAPAMN